MDEKERRAIVWREIESKAFHPFGKKIERWLQIYKRSLPNLWEVAQPLPGKPDDPFDLPISSLQCWFFNGDGSGLKFTAAISAAERTFWQLEVDSGFYSKTDGLNQTKEYPSEHKNDRDLKSDVETVLDGMLFHPRCHIHGDKLAIPSLDNHALDPHEIRLGGGIENLFMFLAHVRYQFCLVSPDKRNEEQSRLVQLCTAAIAHKSNITPAQLFPIQ
jgi:hypothetical protein